MPVGTGFHRWLLPGAAGGNTSPRNRRRPAEVRLLPRQARPPPDRGQQDAAGAGPTRKITRYIPGFESPKSRVDGGETPLSDGRQAPSTYRLSRDIQSLFSYIRPGYIPSGYNRDHGGTTEPERSRNVKLKRTCHPVFVLDLTQNDLLGV